MITVNGEKIDVADITIAEYLENNNYSIKKIAVELNGEIIRKACYGETILKDGDTLEVVSFVSGG